MIAAILVPPKAAVNQFAIMVNGVFASLKLVKCSHLTNSDVSTVFSACLFCAQIGALKTETGKPKRKKGLFEYSA